MLASKAQARLRCVHQVVQALGLSAGQAINPKLLALVELAQRNNALSALVAVVREQPACLLTAAVKLDPRLLTALASIDVSWTEFARDLLPKLVHAAEVAHEFALEDYAQANSPHGSAHARPDAGAGLRLRPGADRRDPDRYRLG